MLAQTALAAGLVDGIGTLDEALRLASRPPAQARAEDEGPDPAEVELPFHSRLDRAVEELAALVDHATIRAALRAKEGRRAFSESQLTALRSIHESFSALLTADDPPPEPAPVVAVEPPVPVASVQPATPAPPKRFRSNSDWLAYLQEITH
jgi:hypothetical protein